MQARRARHLHRQEIGKQRAVQEIDAQRAAVDIRPPPAVEAAAGIGRNRPVGDGAQQFRQCDDVALAEVQPLRADGRKTMCGLADQGDAALTEAMRRGWLSAPIAVREGPPPRYPVAPLPELLEELRADRDER